MRSKLFPAGVLWMGLVIIGSAFVTCPSVEGASDEEFLKLIEEEPAKIGSGMVGDTPTEGAPGGMVRPPGAGFQAGMTPEQFAQTLHSQYYGSYVFFDKLPPETREEIYRDYLNGSSVEQVRAKITERFMNH